MRNTNCRNIRREIEEARSADFLSAAARSHLEVCIACETLSRQQIKLRAILSSLDRVEAPEDFDYRVRSRLAAEKRSAARVLPFASFSLSLRSAAVAVMLLLVGSAFVLVSFKARPDATVAGIKPAVPVQGTSQPAGSNSDQGKATTPNPVQVAQAPTATEPVPLPVSQSSLRRAPGALNVKREVAGFRGRRFGTLDQTQSGAPVERLGESYPTAAFPINASYQSLKVSVDDSRGASRTISLPSVSFGSQRTLSQSASPLIASARDIW